MTDINDFSSPHDASDEARAEDPPEGYNERKPLDLDNLQKLYDLAEAPGGLPTWGRVVYLEVPGLIAELLEARRRIAEFEALPVRERWAVTTGPDDRPGPFAYWYGSAADAEAALLYQDNGGQLWRERTSVHPWEPFSTDAPF